VQGPESDRSHEDAKEVTVAMETTTYWMATPRAAAFGVPVSRSLGGVNVGGALLPVQQLSTTGDVRPAIVFADGHDVRTWSPPI
jgi:hypothetical protein